MDDSAAINKSSDFVWMMVVASVNLLGRCIFFCVVG